MTGCGVVTSTVALSFDEEKLAGTRKLETAAMNTVEIFNLDAQEFMAKIPDQSVDVIVTDPALLDAG